MRRSAERVAFTVRRWYNKRGKAGREPDKEGGVDMWKKHAGDPPPDIRVPPRRHRRGGTEYHRCGLRNQFDSKAIFGKPSETVGRKAMGPNAVSGRAKNCPWTILIVGRSPTIMSTVRESAGRSPAGNGSPAADFGKPPETTGRKAMGSKRPEGRRTARPQN